MHAAPRSPEAERHDPPLDRRDWKLERRLGWSDFLADAAARFGEGDALARTLWHGGLQIDGRPVDADAPPPVVAAGSWVRAWSFRWEPARVAFEDARVLYDAAGLVAVDKPAWLPAQGTRASQRISLEGLLRERLGEPALVAVHRLDRQTSGLSLFARSRAVASRIGRAFAAGEVDKRYLAWVSPPPAEDAFAVRGALARVADPARFRFGLGAAGAPSETGFRVLGRAGGRALLEARPRTGRTHQIRVHLAARGAPIAGDDLYGPAYRPEAASAAGRVLLHAAALALPLGAGRLELEAPLPADMGAPG